MAQRLASFLQDLKNVSSNPTQVRTKLLCFHPQFTITMEIVTMGGRINLQVFQLSCHSLIDAGQAGCSCTWGSFGSCCSSTKTTSICDTLPCACHPLTFKTLWGRIDFMIKENLKGQFLSCFFSPDIAHAKLKFV